MSETPTRPGRVSRLSSRPGSRSNTPRSKTPVRTPTRRRRATIVSANLVASRRPHRQSTTPQNILRILSRALVRGREPDQNTPAQESVASRLLDMDNDGPSLNVDDIPGSDYHGDLGDATDIHGDLGDGEDLHRVPLGDFEDKENDVFYDAGNVLPTSSLFPDDIDARREPLSDIAPRSALFSDIVLPEGIMPDVDDMEETFIQQHPMTDPFNSDTEDQSRHIPPTPPHTSPRKPRVRSETPRVTKNPLKPKAVFKHAQSYTKKPIAKECVSLLSEISGEFFDNISSDLASYAEHAKRKDTINVRDAFLMMKRQRLATDVQSLVDLVDEIMPLEDVMELKRNERKLK